jgi:AcrR family transcriptional regulator
MKKAASDRQIEIIEAAGKILMEKGLKGLTTKNLALEMEFSESALYRHFNNKEDIVVLLLDFLAANMKERLEKAATLEASPIEKLKAIFASQFTYFNQNPHFIVAILSEILLDETGKVITSMMKIIAFKTQLITSVIEEGKTKNELTHEISTPEMVHIIIGTFRLIMLQWKLSKFEIDIVKEGNKIIDSNLKLMKI